MPARRKLVDGKQQCFKCKEWKSLDQNFHKSAKNVNGYAGSCRDCDARRRGMPDDHKVMEKGHYLRKKHIDGRKQCSQCKEMVLLKDFIRSSRAWDGLAQECSTCHNHRKLKSKYGLTPIEIKNLILKQENKCIYCMNDLGIDINIDHCHDSGRIRGIAHKSCNSFEGIIKKVREMGILSRIIDIQDNLLDPLEDTYVG